MNHSLSYHPWGDPVASGISALLFAAWIGTSNLFLIVLFITNPKLLNSRQNIVILHNAVADLTVGVFYCPLAAEYYFRGFWAHGCSSYFVWFTFAFPLCFLTAHSVLMLLVLRTLSFCFRSVAVRLNRTVINLVFFLAFVVLWVYLIVIGAYLTDSRHADIHVTIAPKVWCKAVVATVITNVIDVLVYFLPASFCIVLLVVVTIREKTNLEVPRTQLQLDANTEQLNGMSLCVLTAFTLLTCLLPLPSFLATSLMLRVDTCDSRTCFYWLGAIAAVGDWLMLAKSGIIPLIMLFAVGDFRSSMQGVLHSFRRLPTSDERDLVPPVEDASDDAPFSSM